MKKIKKDLIASAWQNLTAGSTNKFWGLIAILSAIKTDTNINASTTYQIDAIKLSKTLERLFYFGDLTKIYSDSGNYVTFSSKWAERAQKNFMRKKVAISDMAIFFNINRDFDEEIDLKYLVDDFIKEIKLKEIDVEILFDIDYQNLQFLTESTYSKNEIIEVIQSKYSHVINNDTLTIESPFSVVSHPAELSRAPFIQSLYAAQSNFECLLLTKFDFNNLYQYNKFHPDTNIIVSSIIDKKYSLGELGSILGNLYNNAEEGMKVASIYIYGIKHGKAIISSEYNARQIIEASGLNKSYDVELSKALRIYKAINEKMYGVSFYTSEKISYIDKDIAPISFIQKIYYGAPGTGKSHKIKELTNNTENKIIVTFHPDTDYSSFVGCYKPMVSEDKKTITYGFTPQAFAKAYVSAWNNLDEPYYLVIEEINRGNCAQIFGDIFQLLDRHDNGFSKYVIDVDSDFEGYLERELSSAENYKEAVSQLAEISIDEFKFSKIALPNNLHILATMNTSDQSLFPMDSAFKRRWDWEYIPIEAEKVKDVKIEIGAEIYSWSAFLDSVNKFIYEVNTSEDKQLGPYFIKANETTNVITFEQFRSKVMFYLWFEIYKDEDRDSIFKTNKGSEDNKKMESFTFGDLFKSDGIELLHKFMKDSMQLTTIPVPTDMENEVGEESQEVSENE